MGEIEVGRRDAHSGNIFKTPPRVLEFLVNGFHGLNLDEKGMARAGEILIQYDGIGLGMNAYGLYAINSGDTEKLHDVFDELDKNYEMFLKNLNDKVLRFGLHQGSKMTVSLFDEHFKRLGYS